MLFPNFQNAAMFEINSRISRLGTHGQPQEAFLHKNITEWKGSKARKFMLTSQAYYGNDNEINERKRYFIDRKGIRQEAVNLANSKLSHPFMRKLTNQKVNYLLSKEFSINCADDDGFNDALSQYLNKRFYKMLKNVGRDAIINGIAWVQVYYDAMGNLGFKRIPAEEIIPFWADADHTILDAVLRIYAITHYLQDGTTKEITKVEYHTNEGVWYYVYGDRGLTPDPDRPSGVRGHFIIEEEAIDDTGKSLTDENGNKIMNQIEATWDKVPFVAFKYNADEVSLLKLIKPLIDDYDLNTSSTSNTLLDIPDSIKIVKNYDGADKTEFTQNLNLYRTAFVSGDGDVTSLETKMDVAALDSHLNRLRRDIYEAGSGVDSQEVSLGNASGVALKFRYADLDIDTDNMANEFMVSIEELIWFIKVDMMNRGIGDFIEADYDIIFNTDGIINEAEVIADVKNSVGIISDETILANHPWVNDTQQELDRVKKEREEKLKEMQEMMDDGMDDGFGKASQGGQAKEGE